MPIGGLKLDCSVVSVMCAVTKRLRLESRGFRYEVALYLSNLHIKFVDEIKANLFEFQAQFLISLRPKLNWRLGYAVSTIRVSF